MVSEKQIIANQENAKLAKGAPRDTAVSRFNAVKHSILSKHIIEGFD